MTISSALEFIIRILQILRAISQSMNFTPGFYESDDVTLEKRGTTSSNGSFMANIEEIVSRNSGRYSKNSRIVSLLGEWRR